MAILDLQRIYVDEETGEESKILMDLVSNKKEVDIRKDFIADKFQVRKYQTLFNGFRVRELARHIPKEYYGLMKLQKNTQKVRPDVFARKFIELMKRSIYESWDPKKFHVILHSGGWDSRILSMIITKMYQTQGTKWLGNIIFVCKEPESECFHKVMDFEGWSKEYRLIYNGGIDPLKYNDRFLDFDNLYVYINDAIWSCNFIRLALEDIMKKVPGSPTDINEYQIYGAGYFTEMFQFKARFFDILEYYYRPINGQYSTSGNILYPILNEHIFKLFIKSDYGKGVGPMDLKKLVMENLDPKLLNIPRYDDLNIYNSPYLQLSQETLMWARLKYVNSWYGKNIRPDVGGQLTTSYKPSVLWNLWSAAALCEHLISIGIKVN